MYIDEIPRLLMDRLLALGSFALPGHTGIASAALTGRSLKEPAAEAMNSRASVPPSSRSVTQKLHIDHSTSTTTRTKIIDLSAALFSSYRGFSYWKIWWLVDQTGALQVQVVIIRSVTGSVFSGSEG